MTKDLVRRVGVGVGSLFVYGVGWGLLHNAPAPTLANPALGRERSAVQGYRYAVQTLGQDLKRVQSATDRLDVQAAQMAVDVSRSRQDVLMLEAAEQHDVGALLAAESRPAPPVHAVTGASGGNSDDGSGDGSSGDD
jgi:hypothetical protein